MRILLWIVGLPGLLNGLWMLYAPESWYHDVPAAVPDTGPLNLHFVRDVGAAYITGGAALCAAAELPAYRRAGVYGATTFFTLHALIHVVDLLTGRLPPNHWLIDAPGVFIPTAILVVACLPRWWQDEPV